MPRVAVALLLLACVVLCSALGAHATLLRPTATKASLQRQAEALGGHHLGTSTVSSIVGAGSATTTSVVNVMDFGAVADGKTDNTKAFQEALNAVAMGGGVVWVPAGEFYFTGVLSMPAYVTLEGIFRAAPSHSFQGGAHNLNGTILMPTFGRGNETASPFITMETDSTIRGITFFYPDVQPDAVPVPYPYTIYFNPGNNQAVIDVELLNVFNGIYAVQAARHFICRVQGQPANIGIYVDRTYDIGRIQNVHWNPWFSDNVEYMSWQLTHGQAFIFARTDWEYVLNTFAFGYAIGYRFIKSPQGSCNGNFLGIGADLAVNASVQVDAADPWGIMITNGEFTSFMSKQWGDITHNSTQVVVTSSDVGGPVRFVNSAFWGPSTAIARLDADATLGFAQCTFNAWDAKNQGNSALIASAGRLLVQGCDFQADLPQIELGAGVSKAVILGNMIKGSTRITNASPGKVMIGYNADDS